MLELKTREKLADAARVLAQSYELVYHNSLLYVPIDFETGSSEPIPPPDRKIWKPLDRKEVQRFAAQKAKILFANESELVNFEGMLRQLATPVMGHPRGVFIQTTNGLRVLNEDGLLVEPDGMFYPNCMTAPLNENPDDKAEVFSVLTEWLDSEEEAHSLLYHLATALAPSWSAVKYVLLLGEGRNGKSVLLYMLTDLFGRMNISNVSRQEMAERSPVCCDLNSKLLNIVMDGSMDYVKDSGMEKTLIAGETGAVRRLYESSLTEVQTNGLFLEALNQEPKTRDKSSALQKRLVRFRFPKVYPLNPLFAEHMRSQPMLGALLSLLLEHYVRRGEAFEKLAPTQGALELQLDQMVLNSVVFQWLQHVVNDDPSLASKFVGTDVMAHIAAFIPWAESQEGHISYSEVDALQLFKNCFFLKRSSRRHITPRNYWKIVGLKPETELLLQQLTQLAEPDSTDEGGTNGDTDMVVADG